MAPGRSAARARSTAPGENPGVGGGSGDWGGGGPFAPGPHGTQCGAPKTHTQREITIGIIAFIILGLIAGYIAKALVRGADPGGFIVTGIVGVAGALLGGFLAGAIFDADPLDEFFDLSTWLTAIVGSVILLWIYRAVAGSKSRRGRVV